MPTADDGDGYSGPARLRLGNVVFDVHADLRGRFEPIDGRYHWYGRLASHEGLTAWMTRGRDAGVLTTPDGSAACEVSDPDPWQRYRVAGTSTPPFPAAMRITAGEAESR